MKWGRKKKEKTKVNSIAPQYIGKVQEILPPEGVPLRFQVALLGARLGAQLIDIVITVLGLIALVILFETSGLVSHTATTAVAALLFFMIRVPYYAASELIWNGRTIGKRICRIRVVSGTGRSLTAHQIVSRNLMREVEVFTPGTLLLVSSEDLFGAIVTLLWIGALILVPVLNKRNQRLGDIIANTYVIQNPIALLYPDLAAEKPAMQEGQYEFFPNQLDHYGAYELQVLAELLQPKTSPSAAKGPQTKKQEFTSVGQRIRQKIDYAFPVAPNEEEAFLKAFYRAQRAHLEQKKLFGDAREDKFHARMEE